VLEKEGELWLDILWDFRTAEQLGSIFNNAKWKRVSRTPWKMNGLLASKLLIKIIYLSGGLVGEYLLGKCLVVPYTYP